MAFVRKDVKGKDKDFFNSFGIIYENNLVEADRFTMWTVDRERKIYFIYLGGGALEHPNAYALIWKNRKVIITVEVRPSKKSIGLLFEKIIATKELENFNEELEDIIKEIFCFTFKGREVEFINFSKIKFIEEGNLHG